MASGSTALSTHGASLAAEPSSSGFRRLDGTLHIPLCSRLFEALRHTLFATTFDGTPAHQIPGGAELSILYALGMVREIDGASRQSCQSQMSNRMCSRSGRRSARRSNCGQRLDQLSHARGQWGTELAGHQRNPPPQSFNLSFVVGQIGEQLSA